MPGPHVCENLSQDLLPDDANRLVRAAPPSIFGLTFGILQFIVVHLLETALQV